MAGSTSSFTTSSRNRSARRFVLRQQRVASADALDVMRYNACSAARFRHACNASAHHDIRAN